MTPIRISVNLYLQILFLLLVLQHIFFKNHHVYYNNIFRKKNICNNYLFVDFVLKHLRRKDTHRGKRENEAMWNLLPMTSMLSLPSTFFLIVGKLVFHVSSSFYFFIFLFLVLIINLHKFNIQAFGIETDLLQRMEK